MGIKDVFHPAFLSKCTKRSDILSSLSRLHNVMSDMDQDVKRPEGFENTAAHLIRPQFLNSDDKEIRLLSLCCIVDVLRLFAPNAPYSNTQMVAIFDVLVGQLRGLSTYTPESSMGKKIAYIVVSLARVKSCVVLVELSTNGHPEPLESLFDSLLNSVRPYHDDESK